MEHKKEYIKLEKGQIFISDDLSTHVLGCY